MNQIRKSQEVILANDFLEKMDLYSIVYPLWLNRWLIGLVTAVCLLFGSLYAYIKVPLYSSEILLQLEESGSMMSFDKNLSPSSMLGSRRASAAEVQTALIKSRYILEPTVQRLGLDLVIMPKYFPIIGRRYAKSHAGTLHKPWWGSSRYAWGGEKLQIEQFHVPASEENTPFTLVAAGNGFYNLYDVNKKFILKGKTGEIAHVIIAGKGVYSLKVDTLEGGENTHFIVMKQPAQKIAELLSSQLKILDLSQEMQIQSNTGILKVSLIGSNPTYIVNVLNVIADIATVKNAQKKAEEATKTLEFINKKLPTIRKSLDEAETKLSQYLAKAGMIDISSESKLLLGEIASMHKTLNTIKMDKAAGLQKYTPAHPYILALNERRKFFQTELQIVKRKLSQLPIRDQAVLGLMRDVRVKNELYLIMLNKIQSLEVIKGGTISDVGVLGLATIPNHLSNGTFSILLFSGLTGLLMGFALVHGQRLFNRKISDPTMIERQFGLTNMAIIPYSNKQNAFKSHLNNLKTATVPLLAHSHPKDLSIEALRSFRTSLQFTMMEAHNNIITITGVSPGVGKSFISVNFAYLLADAGKKILLIDGDIRKGRLKNYFNIGAADGLSEVICGKTKLESAIISCPNTNLDILPTGTYPPNPAELLMSQRFKDLLDQVSKMYDFVIIDTAPILAVTDAVVIAQHASANFMVLASNMHESKDIELALKRLEANGVKVNGTVFNFSKQAKGIYRYKQVYNYQYEYK